MEKTKRAAVVPVSYGWSDVGSWQAVWDPADKDTAGNASQGTAVFVDSKSSYAASDKALVSLFGVKNLVVISSEDAVLVANRHSVDGMRQLVQRLKDVAPKITEDHLQMHWPWGYYHSLDTGTRYQVKRIMVNAGGRLTLQLHQFRALGDRARHRAGYGRQRRQDRARERIRVHSDRDAAPAGESRQDRAWS